VLMMRGWIPVLDCHLARALCANTLTYLCLVLVSQSTLHSLSVGLCDFDSFPVDTVFHTFRLFGSILSLHIPRPPVTVLASLVKCAKHHHTHCKETNDATREPVLPPGSVWGHLLRRRCRADPLLDFQCPLPAHERPVPHLHRDRGREHADPLCVQDLSWTAQRPGEPGRSRSPQAPYRLGAALAVADVPGVPAHRSSRPVPAVRHRVPAGGAEHVDYDSCTDGFTIDVTLEEERGIVQGIMVGGHALSAVVIAAVKSWGSSWEGAGSTRWPSASAPAWAA
jgi:hypothetical protein